MKIEFSKAIEGEFYDVSGEVKLDDSLLDGRPQAKFTGNLKAEGWYVVTDDNVAVKLKVEVPAKFLCDRCGDETEKVLTADVSEMFFKNPPSDDCYTYSNFQIDLDPVIEERVVLSVPTQILCKENCKGLCPKCGKRLEDGPCNCETIRPDGDKKNPFADLLDLI